MQNLIKTTLVTLTFSIAMLSTHVMLAQENHKLLSIDECRKMALENNKRIQISEKEAEAASFIKKSAFTQYLPNISFSGGYMRINKDLQLLSHDLFLPIVPFSTIDPATGNFNPQALKDPATAMKTLVINPKTGLPMMDASGNPVFQQYAMIPADKMKIDLKNLYFAKISVVQPIFTGLKITETNNIARAGANIAKEKIVLTKAETLVKTDEAYWRVVSLQEKVSLAKSYIGLLDRLVSDLENIYQEGIITKNDLLKAQVKQNEAKLKLLKAENGLVLSKMALAQIIGANHNEIEVKDSINRDAPISLLSAEETQHSIDTRAEIIMLKEKAKIAHSGRNLAISRFLPNIAITGGYGWLSPNPYNGMKKELGGDWNIGVVCSIPILHWGDKIFTTKAAKRAEEAVQYELEDAKEMINLQITQAQYKYSEAIKKVELTQLSKQQAEENLEISKNNFTEGRVKVTDLLEAQLQWEQSCSEFIDAQIELQTFRLELDKATGEIYKTITE